MLFNFSLQAASADFLTPSKSQPGFSVPRRCCASSNVLPPAIFTRIVSPSVVEKFKKPPAYLPDSERESGLVTSSRRTRPPSSTGRFCRNVPNDLNGLENSATKQRPPRRPRPPCPRSV